MKDAPVRLALIGAGSIGRRHCALIQASPRCSLAAIADPAPAAAELAASVGARYDSDYRQLLDATPIDGVIVAAPNALHEPIGVACAQRGLPFLMEKPVTATVEGGLRLINAVKAAGVRGQVGHHRRFDPAVEQARTIISSGELGDIVACSGLWLARKHDDYYDVAWRTEAPGGGPLIINLIHDIDMLRAWFGEIASVYAETTSRHRRLSVEDSGAILLRFESGPLATIAFSDATPSPWGWERNSGDNPHTPGNRENCFRIAGTRGSLEFPNLVTWGGGAGWLEQLTPTPRPSRRRQALADQLDHFVNVIQGEAPRVTLQDGLANLAVIEAIAKSSRTRSPAHPSFAP